MSAAVIHGEGLGKSYRRGAVQQSSLLLASSAMVAVVLIGGLLFFQRMEGAVADRV